MDRTAACPTAGDLVDLIQGHVAEPELSRLAEHLEGCPVCQAAARTLPPGDTLLHSLRGEDPAADSIARAVPRPLIEELKQIPARESGARSGTAGMAAGATATDFLAPARLPDELGQLGPYRVLKLLGQGGMGAVFLAEDPKLQRRVALKVMLPNVAADPTAKERFLREARAAAAIKSDHIVTIYQVDEVDGVPFLAMELLEGRTLEDALRGPRLSADRVVAVARDIAEGLAAAHEKGLVHRDIKPSNLWLEDKGRVKILDFGLARIERDDPQITRQGALVGTPAYMAPEQVRGEGAVDARADLFSLGCVLYHLCIGAPPFRAPSVMGTLIAVALDNPPEPTRLDTLVPPELSALIMQLLAKDPARRPQSAREVIARLDAIRKGEPSGVSRRVTRGLAGIAALLALTVLAGVIFYQRPDGKVVRIETNDPSIKVAFDGGDLQVVGAYKEPITLRSGKVGLKVAHGDFQFETDKLIVNKGDKVVLRVDVVDGRIQIVRDGKGVLDSKELPGVVADPERRAAEWVLSLGGQVEINGDARPIRAVGDLPKDRFTINMVTVVYNGAVTDAGLQNLKGLKGLTRLNIGGTRVTDAGLAQLKELTALTDLVLERLKLTDAGLAHLKGLKGLESLNLYAVPMTDAGLAQLTDLKGLTTLNLTETNLTQAGMARLEEFKKLSTLSLRTTAATDATLEHLKHLQLTFLDLVDTKLTDAGLARLQAFKGLKVLMVERTAVTPKGLAEFHTALPGCRVEYSGGVIEANK